MMGCLLKTEKELEKLGRSVTDSKVSSKGDICVVRWLDNSVVTLGSTLSGVEPRDQVKHWSESAKNHIYVNRPHAVKVYNDDMGGMDKIDFLISLYCRIQAKTRKWPVRMIFHFLDFAVTNSWLEYHDFELEHGTPKSQVVDLLGFRDEVSHALIQCQLIQNCRSVGRPRLSNENDAGEVEPLKRARPAVQPVEDVCYDLVAHWPESVDGESQRCKLEKCQGHGRVRCMKCNVYLCLHKNRNCFKAFHTK